MVIKRKPIWNFNFNIKNYKLVVDVSLGGGS